MLNGLLIITKMKKMTNMRLLLLLVFFYITNFSSAKFSSSVDWPNWRGPNYDGSSLSSNALPERFGPKQGLSGKSLFQVHLLPLR